MDFENTATLVGISLPLITIAGTAIAYLMKLYSESASRRRQQFFELMDLIDTNGTLASKLAAFYQLRQFPEHKDFIIRFCEATQFQIDGSSKDIVIAELRKTIDFFQD